MKQTKKSAVRQSPVVYDVCDPFTVGAQVRVSAERVEGKRGLRFTYLRHVTNNLTGSQWVDVLNKDGSIKSFKPDEVSIIAPKRKYTRRKNA